MCMCVLEGLSAVTGVTGAVPVAHACDVSNWRDQNE